MRCNTLSKYSLRTLGVAALVVCVVLQFRFAVIEQRTFTSQTGEELIDSLRSPRLITFSAKQKHLFDADMQGALSLLQRALALNPYYVPAWLCLAELDNDMGNKQGAIKILNYVDTLTHNIKWWRWDKALTAYQLGVTELLPDELGYIIKEIPGKSRNDALQLAFRLWEDPGELVQNLGTDNVMHLFNFAVAKKYPEKAIFLWQKLADLGITCPEKNALSFLNMLLGADQTAVAGEIWHQHFSTGSILYNGNFAAPFLQNAFGWRASSNKGFEQRFEDIPGNNRPRNLFYRFKGWDNLNFAHLYQIVPLQNGKKFQLTAEFKSAQLTTDQRPFLEVYGYKCKMDYARTEMVTPEQDWQTYSLEFSVPENCAAVVVRLRRTESNQIDNKLSGKMWLRNVEITEQGETEGIEGKQLE